MCTPRITRQRKIVPLRTFSPKVSEIQRAWYVVDADGLVLGAWPPRWRASCAGSTAPTSRPHVDTGDHVVIVNADKVVLTSGKADDKMAYRHSGYPGGLRSTSYAELLEKSPDEMVRRSDPRHAAQEHPRPAMLGKLNVYAGPDHPHAAQRPEPLELPAARRAS